MKMALRINPGILRIVSVQFAASIGRAGTNCPIVATEMNHLKGNRRPGRPPHCQDSRRSIAFRGERRYFSLRMKSRIYEQNRIVGAKMSKTSPSPAVFDGCERPAPKWLYPPDIVLCVENDLLPCPRAVDAACNDVHSVRTALARCGNTAHFNRRLDLKRM